MRRVLTLNNKLNYDVMGIWDFIVSNVHSFALWAFTVYLVPTYEMISVIQFLLIIDFITGVWKSFKIGEEITSKRMSDSIAKFILYGLGVIVTYVLQHHIAKDLVNIMFLFGGLVCTRETKSIIENIETITDTQIWFYIKDHVLNITQKIKMQTPRNQGGSSNEDNEA